MQSFVNLGLCGIFFALNIMIKFERYYKAVNFLEGLLNIPIKKDYMSDKDHESVYIKRMRFFLNMIGNPDRGMKLIHVSGTSGKGTVTNMVHEILLASGRRVGSFTSPYVTTSIEKIKVDDKYISPDEFADIVDYLKPYIDKAYAEGPYGMPSYFEIFFAIALIYFKKRKCEWVVLEVGLGGRYDATNVIEKPIVTAITNIDYDHTEILGRTLPKIAFDKAGIIKPGSVFFTTEQRWSIRDIFQNICEEKRVIIEKLPHQDDYMEYNKELSRAIAKRLNIDDDDIKKGIENAKLMCRFEIMSHKPIVILDGAHNRSKMRTTIFNLKNIKYNKLHLIIGIANDKDHTSILSQIIPFADHVYFTRFQNKSRKCSDPKNLYLKSRRYLKRMAKAKINLDHEHALLRAIKSARNNDLILVTGSFYLAGELRKYWFPESVILRRREI